MLKMTPEKALPLPLEIDCREISCYEDFVVALNERLVAHFSLKWTGEIKSLTECLLCIEQENLELVIRGADRCKALFSARREEGDVGPDWMQFIDVFHQNRDWMKVTLD